MQLTKNAQTAKQVLEKMREIYAEKMDSGTAGMESVELQDYIFACKSNIITLNKATQLLNDCFAQEEIDPFYLEQHTNEERLEYTMKSIIESYFPVGHDGVYLKFIEQFIDGFQDGFNFMYAENAGQEAREDGSTFRKGYALNTLEQLIDMCKARINYEDSDCATLIYNGTALKLFSEILEKII